MSAEVPYMRQHILKEITFKAHDISVHISVNEGRLATMTMGNLIPTYINVLDGNFVYNEEIFQHEISIRYDNISIGPNVVIT